MLTIPLIRICVRAVISCFGVDATIHHQKAADIPNKKSMFLGMGDLDDLS